MIISHKYKFIFIKTRKTAGSSIQIYLSELCGEGDVVSTIDRPERPYRPRNYRGLYNPVLENSFESFLVAIATNSSNAKK